MARKPTYEELAQRNKELEKEVVRFKRTEQALRESKEKYHLLFNTVSDAIILFDGETKKIVDINDACLRTYGYSRNEFLKLKHDDITAEPEKSDETIKEALSGKMVKIPIRYHKRNNGDIFPVEICAETFGLGNRHLICSVVRDISKRSPAERALRDSEARYRAMVQNQTEMICCFLPDGTLTFVNEAYCRYFNKNRKELIGKKFLPLIPEDDRETVFNEIVSLGSDHHKITHEHRVIAPNGEIRWQRWTNQPIFDDQNHLTEYQAVGWDITERVRAEKALQKAHDELEFRVMDRTRELKVQSNRLREANMALKVLLEQSEVYKKELEDKVLSNVKDLVTPYLEKLRMSRLPSTQKELVNIIESNLSNIVSPFIKKLSVQQHNLTPKEIRVANLVKAGKKNKEIAKILGVSHNTVIFHRYNIRTKLGLRNKNINLKSHLASFDI